jgi:hypothetical protein
MLTERTRGVYLKTQILYAQKKEKTNNLAFVRLAAWSFKKKSERNTSRPLRIFFIASKGSALRCHSQMFGLLEKY